MYFQGAVPQILEKTDAEFYSKTTSILKEDAEICWDLLNHIPCMACPHKPDGAMFVMVVHQRSEKPVLMLLVYTHFSIPLSRFFTGKATHFTTRRYK